MHGARRPAGRGERPALAVAVGCGYKCVTLIVLTGSEAAAAQGWCKAHRQHHTSARGCWPRTSHRCGCRLLQHTAAAEVVTPPPLLLLLSLLQAGKALLFESD